MKMQLKTGRNVEVNIHHRRPDLKNDVFLLENTFHETCLANNPSTLAQIKVDGQTYEDYTVCHTRDMFVKRKGSRLALSRAMELSPLTREERAEIHSFVFNGYRKA